MGKVRPFCHSSLEANILRPYYGPLSENFFIILWYLSHLLKNPHADISYSVKVFWYNDIFSPCKYCNFFWLSIKLILFLALITKFSLGLELSELNQLTLSQNTLICRFNAPLLADNNNISAMCRSDKSDCLVLPKIFVFYVKMAATVVS